MKNALYLLIFSIGTGSSFWFGIPRFRTMNRNRMELRMDDEQARNGIKEELTTRDNYLETRFTRLSSSGHDLTPLGDREVTERLQALGGSRFMDDINKNDFLGEQQKGLYVCAIGGLPLFASGTRLDNLCSNQFLYFSEPCDTDHIECVENKVKCVRSGLEIGIVTEDSKFKINANRLRFLPLNTKWPPESQPENFWGTEGQYRSWNQHEMSKKPLSY